MGNGRHRGGRIGKIAHLERARLGQCGTLNQANDLRYFLPHDNPENHSVSKEKSVTQLRQPAKIQVKLPAKVQVNDPSRYKTGSPETVKF